MTAHTVCTVTYDRKPHHCVGLLTEEPPPRSRRVQERCTIGSLAGSHAYPSSVGSDITTPVVIPFRRIGVAASVSSRRSRELLDSSGFGGSRPPRSETIPSGSNLFEFVVAARTAPIVSHGIQVAVRPPADAVDVSTAGTDPERLWTPTAIRLVRHFVHPFVHYTSPLLKVGMRGPISLLAPDASSEPRSRRLGATERTRINCEHWQFSIPLPDAFRNPTRKVHIPPSAPDRDGSITPSPSGEQPRGLDESYRET